MQIVFQPRKAGNNKKPGSDEALAVSKLLANTGGASAGNIFAHMANALDLPGQVGPAAQKRAHTLCARGAKLAEYSKCMRAARTEIVERISMVCAIDTP